METLVDKILQLQNVAGYTCRIEDILLSQQVGIQSLSSDDLLNLVCNELRLRELAGEQVLLSEYQERFPQIHQELVTQWQVNALLDLSPGGTGEDKYQSTGKLGRYELLREVGRGAMGVVYEAYDSQVRRIVALKRLRSEYTQHSVEFNRFQLEAESVGKLSHPNIVQVFDVGHEQDCSFIVMEYCNEGTLAECLAEPMTFDVAARLMTDLADAMAEAHLHGIVHRDLKPANILLTKASDGHMIYKVSDFGLAKWLERDASATMSGSIVGSPAYMSPEQAQGEKSIGPASDVYSLGALLFQCLTARPPFVGSSVSETLFQVRTCQPLRVRQLNQRVPAALETIVSKCLSKDPRGRYSSAAALRDDLQRFQHGQPILAKPERVGQRIWRLSKRNPVTAFMIALSTLMLVLLLVSITFYSVRLSVALKQSQQAAHQARLEQAAGLLGKANGQRMSKQPGRRLMARDTLRQAIAIGRELKQPEQWFAPYRDEALETCWLSDLTVRTWRKLPVKCLLADVADDGNTVCMIGDDQQIHFYDWDHGQLTASFAVQDQPYGIACLHEQRLLLFMDKYMTCMERTPSGLESKWKFALDHRYGNYAFDADKHRLAIVTPIQIHFVDLKTGAAIGPPLDGRFFKESVAFHPFKPYCLIGSYNERYIEIREIGSKHLVWRADLSQGGPTAVTWTPDGHGFVLIDGDTKYQDHYQWQGTEHDPILIDSQKPTFDVGGGAECAWTDSNGMLVSGWGSTWSLLDPSPTRHIVKTSKLGQLNIFNSIGPKIQGRQRVTMVATGPEFNVQHGMLEMESGKEERLLRNVNFVIYPMKIQSQLQLASIFEDGKWKPIDMVSGELIPARDNDPLSVGRAVMTRQQLFTIARDFAIQFDLRNAGDELVLENARRWSLRPGHPYFDGSPDGATWLAGYWRGYGEESNAGVWYQARGEPAPRRLHSGQSGKFVAVSPAGDKLLHYFQYQALHADAKQPESKRLIGNSLEQPVSFNADGSLAIAGGALWRTADWSLVKLDSPSLASSEAMSFSDDGTQAIFQTLDGRSQLVDVASGQVYMQLDGQVLAYSASLGTLIVRKDNELVFRDLKLAMKSLTELGLKWDGPHFKEATRPKWKAIRLSPELQALKDYAQWMDHVDAVALKQAEEHPDDGHALFQAAMVHFERGRLQAGLELVERSAAALPEAVTPKMWQAYAMAALRRPADAIACASEVLAKVEQPDLQMLRSSWYLEISQPEAAIKDADEAASQNPLLERRANVMRLLAYRQLGDLPREQLTQQELDKSNSGDADFAQMAFNLSSEDIYLWNRVVAEYYASRVRSTDAPEVSEWMIWYHLRSGHYQAALDLADKRAQMTGGPMYAEAALRAHCYAATGDLEKARWYLEQARAEIPKTNAGDNYGWARTMRLRVLQAETALNQITP